ncbi:HEAT repeat domain-containing protein, partial [Streptomyces sp. NPDC002690]
MFDPFIAPSGTLLGLLQRGRGDGTLHALAAPRTEALAALNHCVLSDPRHDWQVENRSLYYARLYIDLDGGLEEIANARHRRGVPRSYVHHGRAAGRHPLKAPHHAS